MAHQNRNRNRSFYASDENWDEPGRRRDDDYNQRDNYGSVNYSREKDFDTRRQYGNNFGYGSYNDYQQGYHGGSEDQWYGTQGRNATNEWRDDLDRINYDRQNRDDDYRNKYRSSSGDYGNYSGYGNMNEATGWQNAQRGNNYGTGGSAYNRSGNFENRNRFENERGNYTKANRGERDWWEKTRDEVSSWFGDEDAERRRNRDRLSGPHRGKGPKGYQRSDDRVREDVCDRLSENPMLDASNIDIKVEGSEVILSGTVESKEDKRRAEDLAESVMGVRNVQNQLRIEHSRYNPEDRSGRGGLW